MWSIAIMLFVTTTIVLVQPTFASQTKSLTASEQTQQLLSTLLLKVQATTKAINENEAQAGKDTPQLNYSISLPATHQTNLGLELDIDNVALGFNVLRVSEKSLAQQLGIIEGDRIVTVNYIEVNESNKDFIVDQLSSLSSNDELLFDVVRGNEYKTLSIDIKRQYLPAVKLTVGGANNNDNIIECMRQDCIDSFNRWKRASANGDDVATNLLATMYYYGFGTPKDTSKALRYFRKVESKKYKKSGSHFIQRWYLRATTQYQIGLIYLSEPGFVDIEKAVRYLKKAANNDNGSAAFLLSMIHFTDKYQRYEPNETANWLVESYKSNHAFTREFARKHQLDEAFQQHDTEKVLNVLMSSNVLSELPNNIEQTQPARTEFEHAVNQYMTIINRHLLKEQSSINSPRVVDKSGQISGR